MDCVRVTKKYNKKTPTVPFLPQTTPNLLQTYVKRTALSNIRIPQLTEFSGIATKIYFFSCCELAFLKRQQDTNPK